MKLESVEEVYQYALKDEEILTKKHEQRQRGRGSRFQRGRGRSYGEGGRYDNYVQRENLNGKMMTKERLSGKVVILTKEVLVLIKEEVILILEVVFV